MRCAFCFATFQDVKQTLLPKGHLPKEHSIDVVRKLVQFGFSKITFAGGEPTLCPWLTELIAEAKHGGMTTMIVTNGSQLDDRFLKQNRKYLDWIAVSIDSLQPTTNESTGRAISGRKPITESHYRTLIERIKGHGYGLKINTVVNQLNKDENLSEFISWACPQRWKILQVLPIVGQNDSGVSKMKVTHTEFQTFVIRHSNMMLTTDVVPETNDQIKGSYVMVDPAGRFFDNSSGRHKYSDPILEVGVNNSFSQMEYQFEKFILRGGIYDWDRV